MVALAAVLLAACGGGTTGGGGGGTPTLNWYIFHEPSGSFAAAAAACSAASGGEYNIQIRELPTAADGQRSQLVRRSAAKDSSLDILGLDVVWEAEFAGAGWIQPWTGAAPPGLPGRRQGRPGHRHLEGAAGGGPVQQQHPAAVVPQGPGAPPAHDLGPDD
jgi:ABC-type glycerol-3-phosphate transport system substrate-binding protein